MNCLFCRIAEKKILSKVVYEDERVLAFEDVNPQAPIHILIIPKKHISTSLHIVHTDNELIGSMFQVANKIAEEKGIAQRGFRLVMNCNPEAGQTIFHVHLHFLAGRPMHWPPG
ncbi:MAG: histidine triad nucleotide-binding protein [Thermodesulfovibrionia bacterium]|nr:histidine triad nucleotide-binding protein [Thermodesulfovibrionia bacterium]MCK5426684.1 histidine triad nucleotide-binding protein [Thermodesulfovibrionia bacterium]MCK5511964.1 histidine triad nucleotide-binding protein [Thermodesulfovibrionia bacterium]